LAGSLTQDKIKNVFHKLVFVENDKFYTTSSDGSSDENLPGLNLIDDVGFTYGTDDDFKMYYSNSSNGMVLKSNLSSTSNDFISIKNNTNEVFGIEHDGVVKLGDVSNADSPTRAGNMKFYNNNLYISKE
jgi:hypothetical protein